MKRYSIYEIEKLTGGKISKYKLLKAIQRKELVAEYKERQRKGRGEPKYLVNEDDLNEYLKKVGEERRKRITIPGEEFEPPVNTVSPIQYEEIMELKKRVSMLETNQSHVVLLEDTAPMDSSTRRKKLVLEMSGLSQNGSDSRRQEILDELYQLA